MAKKTAPRFDSHPKNIWPKDVVVSKAPHSMETLMTNPSFNLWAPGGIYYVPPKPPTP